MIISDCVLTTNCYRSIESHRDKHSSNALTKFIQPLIVSHSAFVFLRLLISSSYQPLLPLAPSLCFWFSWISFKTEAQTCAFSYFSISIFSLIASRPLVPTFLSAACSSFLIWLSSELIWGNNVISETRARACLRKKIWVTYIYHFNIDQWHAFVSIDCVPGELASGQCCSSGRAAWEMWLKYSVAWRHLSCSCALSWLYLSWSTGRFFGVALLADFRSL